MKALAKKKPERFQTARELSRALQTYLLRRGVFVGPEEVSAFVRDLFKDRIKSREDHLSWAADVTSTINIDQLKHGKLGLGRDDAKGDLSRKGSSASDDGAPTGRKGAGAASRRHKSIPAPKGGRSSSSDPPSTTERTEGRSGLPRRRPPSASRARAYRSQRLSR